MVNATFPDLMPPVQMIVDNKIGHWAPDTVHDEFRKIGEGVIGNMIAHHFIKPTSKVLDVGCGLGRMARALVPFLDGGEYCGMDVTQSSVNWCADAYDHLPHFRFVHADVFSTTYNPTSKVKAEDFTFPFPADHFDFVWSTSLFTHMLQNQVDNYLREMARVMKVGAYCWNTYLLLDDVAADLISHAKPTSRVFLPYLVPGGRVRDINDPESQSAILQNYVIGSHLAHDLKIMEIRYGPWSGRTDSVKAGWQDVIIARKTPRF